MDIQLNFINQSNDANNSQIVIFQKNVATDFDQSVVAWRVIEHCGRGENHPFTFQAGIQVASSDSYGNFTPLLDARPGQSFAHDLTPAGDTLAPAGAASAPNEVQIVNRATEGAINAHIYRGGALLAARNSIEPQQMAAFAFKPTIWIGPVAQIDQGVIMDPAIVDSVNTELSLLGVARASIVMSGGGSGRNARPIVFTLQNAVMA